MRARILFACGVLCTSAVAFAQPSPEDPGAPAPLPNTAPPEPAPTPEPLPPAPPPTPEPAPPPPEPVHTPMQTEASASAGQMALLFNLNNIFTAGTVLGGWQGFGVGVQRELGGNAFVRAGLNAFRVHDPVEIVKTTRVSGPMEVVGYELQLPSSGFSSQHGVSIVVDYAKRLTDRKLAPYVGGGVLGVLIDRRLSYTDDLTVTDQVTEVSNSMTTLSVGVRGILGVRWQLNTSFALFAEYAALLQIFTRDSSHDRTTLTSTATGMPASETVDREVVSTRWLDLDVGLAQGGSLGLIANF